MKGLKKFLTGILAGAMALSLTLSAGTGIAAKAASITLNQSDTAEDAAADAIATYTWYKILSAETDDTITEETTSANVLYYTKNATLATALENSGVFTITDGKLNDGTSVKFVAPVSGKTNDEILAVVTSDAIVALAEKHADLTLNKTSKQYTATGLDVGYYVILSSVGSKAAVQTLGDVEIDEKNTYIITHKTVAKTSYKIGDNVPYAAEVTIPAATKLGSDVILHDSMTAQKLKFNNDVAAKMDGVDFTDYSVTASGLTDGCTFEIKIPVTEAVLGKTIKFTYSAEVTKFAADENGLVNELFGENNGYKTKPESPTVWTTGFDFMKLFKNAPENKGYTATFEIRTSANDANTALKFVKVADDKYRIADSSDITANLASTDVVVKQNVKTNFWGFSGEEGNSYEVTYYLVEKSTDAAGYNLINTAIPVKITHDGKGNFTVSYPEGKDYIEAVNETGTLLPSTGGIGTTIFYIIGGLLIVAAVVFFVVRRKADAE